jgi:transcriptional regulator with XRE-family HTH domain
MRETFGQRLRRLRERAGLSQSEVGQRCRARGGPSAGYISHLETGFRANPSVALIAVLADVLGCSPAELAGFAESDRNSK